MLTYKMILDEYRNYLSSVMERPEYIYAIDPNGNIGAQWTLGNSKSIYSLDLDELIANASDGWMLTLSVKQDPFYIGN